MAEGALPPASTEARVASELIARWTIMYRWTAKPGKVGGAHAPPRCRSGQSPQDDPRKAHRPPWACRES